VVTKVGDVVGVPTTALDIVRLRTGKRWRSADRHLVQALAHAYWQASRTGVGTALDEPPRLVMGAANVRREKATRFSLWSVSGCVLPLLGVAAGIVGTWTGVHGRLGALLMCAAMPLALVALGALTMGISSLDPQSTCDAGHVRGNSRGLEIRSGREKRHFAWNEVHTLRRGANERSVGLKLAGVAQEVTVPPVRYANLSLLSRTDGLEPGDLLVAVCRHYMEEAE
jgi:hypothetical protein